MFKTVLLLTFSALSFQLSAQSTESLDKMTENACDCALKKDLDKIDASSIELEFGMCIMGAMEVLTQKERDKIDMTDQKRLRKLGEDIGLRMATKCPKVIMLLAKMSEGGKSKSSDAPPPPPPPLNWGKIDGKVKEVIEGEFVTVILIDKDQREQRLIWFGHFNGESDYTANPQLLKGKDLEINYYSQDRYVAKMHDYVTFKQITELKVKE
jgi:hypothetical protein